VSSTARPSFRIDLPEGKLDEYCFLRNFSEDFSSSVLNNVAFSDWKTGRLLGSQDQKEENRIKRQ